MAFVQAGTTNHNANAQQQQLLPTAAISMALATQLS